MSFNLQRLSGASGVVDIARLVRVVSAIYPMTPDDDVVIAQGGNDVLLPDGPPPDAPTLGLQHEIIADNGFPCTVQGGSHTINGGPSLTIPAGNFGIFLWDGTEWVGSLSSGTDTDLLAGDVTGPLGSNVVVGLQTVPIDPGAPALGDVLTFNGAEWIGTPLAPAAITATAFAEVTVDTTTTSNAFVDLIADGVSPLAITQTVLAGQKMVAHFDVSGDVDVSDNGGQASFQILLDGVPMRGTGFVSELEFGVETEVDAAALTWQTPPLAAGAHTLSIQWHADDLAATRIAPQTNILEHASLFVEVVN